LTQGTPAEGAQTGNASPQFSFEGLRRHPDIEAPNLFASDASDRLILDEAGAALAGLDGRRVCVVGDRYGALTLGAAFEHGLSGIRVHQDVLSGELALAENAARVGLSAVYESLPLGEAVLADAAVVLLQLPRSLAELDEIADAIARYAANDVVVYAGGRIKHLSLAMNEVLGRYFGTVRATHARQKSRVLVASDRLRPTDALPYPKLAPNAELGLTIAAHGGAFSGTTLDIGTRFLLTFLDGAAGVDGVDPIDPRARTAIDLGCGTGVLAAALATRRPDLAVIATDQSAAAVESARATMLVNGLTDRVTVVRDTGLSQQPDGSADVIVCNPPFHVGSSVHTGVALSLFRDAARVLRPGGRLFTVFNSHLAYQPELRRIVGATRALGQNPKFTVTMSTKAARGA
jgi:16S rRNA (guanine1207-N2)-methyltransferase